MFGVSRKKYLFFLIILFSAFRVAAQGDFCSDVSFYLAQLSVNCKAIAGKLIAPVKEYRTKKVLPGMNYGQCSGNFGYTNPFIKFYSELLPESATEAKWNALRDALEQCLKAGNWEKISDVVLAINMRNIRWELPEKGFRYIMILEERPDAESAGTIITIELIKTVF